MAQLRAVRVWRGQADGLGVDAYNEASDASAITTLTTADVPDQQV